MGKVYEFQGNPFYVYLKKNHKCFFCGGELKITKKSITINSKSPQAKYYDFDIGVEGGKMRGDVTFTRKLFQCEKCKKNIDFVTQRSIDKIKKWETKILKKVTKLTQKSDSVNIEALIQRSKLEDLGLDDVYESNIVIIKERRNIFSLPCSTFKYMRIWEDKMMKFIKVKNFKSKFKELKKILKNRTNSKTK